MCVCVCVAFHIHCRVVSTKTQQVLSRSMDKEIEVQQGNDLSEITKQVGCGVETEMQVLFSFKFIWPPNKKPTALALKRKNQKISQEKCK